ncbi:MAG: hypothetical protein ABW128_19970 [Rhizorhabdus sp.]
MTDFDTPADTLRDPRERKSSKVILEALDHAEREYRDYNELCRRVDGIYSAKDVNATSATTLGMGDQEYDTFWASMEVLKPAIYAKPPRVVAKPRFSDATPADKVVAELIERVTNSEFERAGIDAHLREVRDDLALLNRGVLWVTYEAKDGKKSICIDHVDRLDYRHEPVRYWPELGWEARCAWMTKAAMRERFGGGIDLPDGIFVTRQDRDDDFTDDSAKAPVWEVWSKADNRVYWVTEGVEDVLDEGEPHLPLRDFFPSPRPAYGTLRRRSLVPVPDYVRYANHLDQINELTSRIYGLLGEVRMRGLVPAGGDVADAIQTAMRSTDDSILVPVPGAALMAGSGAAGFVQWIPLAELAAAISGLIQARTQLFADFDRLSGISDIMRGETEADETLGAQRIKTQYGSVRVKDKTEEIIRLARDGARVSVEIICDKFTKDDLLEISQMTIPSKRDVERDIDAVTKAAKEELKALGNNPPPPGEDPAQAQQALQQAQQAIAEKYAPDLQRLANTVVIEDVMKIIKDRRDRALIIDIETDSTVMVDEAMEKQTRSEMFQAVTGSFGALPQFAALGDQGIKLFGALVEFTLQPYTRGNRQIQAQLDELIENAPEIAAKMAAQQGDQGDAEGLAEANKTLAQAEQMKAQAAMAAVESRSQLAQAETQRKVAEMQTKAAESERKHELELAKAQEAAVQAADKNAGELAKRDAEIDKIRADTAAILASIGLDVRKQDLAEYTAASNEQARVVDQQMDAVGSEREHARAERGEDRADRGQDFAERTAVTETE